MAENITFEAAVKRLEEIVRILESGQAPLDQSLALFEEGVKLTTLCSNKISEAEKKVEMLVKGKNGEVTAEEFKGRNED